MSGQRAASSTPGQPLRAGLYSLVHHGVSEGLRIAAHLVLARLLSVEAFGLMAIVNSCTNAVDLFSDLGIGQKIVQSRRGDERAFLDTAFTLKSLRGLILWGVTWLLAWPVAAFYGAPELVYLVPVVGLAALFSGLQSTSPSTLERHFQLGRLVALQLGAQLAAAGAMIAWAVWAPSVWALVVGGLVLSLVMLVGSHTVLPGPRNRWRWERAAALEIYAFGRWMVPATIVYFALVLSHRLILGAFVDTAVLGLFNIAAFLAGFVPSALEMLSARVLLPLFAHDEAAAPAPATLLRLRRARAQLLAVGLPPLCALVVWGPELVGLLYDVRYAGAGWMVQVLAAGALVACLNAPAHALLMAHGQTRRLFFAQVGGAVLFAGFVGAGLAAGGWQGVVVGLAAAPVARYPALAWALHKQRCWQPTLDSLSLLGAALLVTLGFASKL